jgi:hypothetical protein
VELYLGGAGERPPASSSPTWEARGQVGAVIGRGGGGPARAEAGWAGVNVETRQPGGGGPARAAAMQASGRALLKGANGGGPRRRHVVWRGGGGGPMWRLELTGDGHR